MKRITRNAPAPDPKESGLSLIEVLVAIAIIAVVATASATLAITGLAAAATQERRQIAVTIASSTMEAITATPVASLASGRTKTAVQFGWTANSTVPGVSVTYPIWDSTTTGTSAVAVGPTTVPQAGTNFTVETVIGVCFQKLPPLTSDCTATVPSPLSTVPSTPSDSMKLIRAIVIVKWTAGRSCPSACSYVSSTLIDPNSDLNWVIRD